jgi:hypothetical protein
MTDKNVWDFIHDLYNSTALTNSPSSTISLIRGLSIEIVSRDNYYMVNVYSTNFTKTEAWLIGESLKFKIEIEFSLVGDTTYLVTIPNDVARGVTETSKFESIMIPLIREFRLSKIGIK